MRKWLVIIFNLNGDMLSVFIRPRFYDCSVHNFLQYKRAAYSSSALPPTDESISKGMPTMKRQNSKKKVTKRARKKAVMLSPAVAALKLRWPLRPSSV